MIPLVIIGLGVVLLAIWLIRKKSVLGREREVSESLPAQQLDKNGVVLYAHVAGWLLKKSSRNPENKIRFVQRYFEEYFSDETISSDIELFRAMKHAVHIRGLANSVNRKMKLPQERIRLMDFLIALAFEDGDINQREYVAIARFAELTGVRLNYIEQEVLARREHLHPDDRRDATMDLLSNRSYHTRKSLECLGLEIDAGPAEIKKAYRKLAKLHHPDKFMHASPEVREEAAIRFREIQAAYEFLMQG